MFVARLLDQGEHLGKACKRLRGLLCGTQMLKLAFPIRLCDPDIFFKKKLSSDGTTPLPPGTWTYLPVPLVTRSNVGSWNITLKSQSEGYRPEYWSWD